MKKTDYAVSPREFIQAWQSSRTASEAATKLCMPKHIVLARVSYYRARGANLKKMPRESNSKLDVRDLNDYIEHINKNYGVEAEQPIDDMPTNKLLDKDLIISNLRRVINPT